jgi:hypothetical protein
MRSQLLSTVRKENAGLSRKASNAGSIKRKGSREHKNANVKITADIRNIEKE